MYCIPPPTCILPRSDHVLRILIRHSNQGTPLYLPWPYSIFSAVLADSHSLELEFTPPPTSAVYWQMVQLCLHQDAPTRLAQLLRILARFKA